MRQDTTPAPLFSEAELLDVLTGVNVGLDKDDLLRAGATHVSAPGPSVNVVLDGDVFSSEKAFEDFMESLASDDDVKSTTVSPSEEKERRSVGAAQKKRKLEAATEKTPVNKPKPKRKRRKHELDHLRAVAAELEKKLKELNHSRGRDKPGAGQFWRHISNQMMSERQEAVGENARLRELIKEQVKSVKVMQKVLAKTPDLSKMGFTPVCSDLKPAALYSSKSKELYRDLFKNVSSSYSDGVGSILQKTSMPTPSIVGSRKMNMEMEMVGKCGPRMCLQFMESRFIPFGFTRIGDHAWNFLLGSDGHKDFQMVLQREGNEMFGHCVVDSPAGPAQLMGNMAVRRYSEPNKLTFVWECDGESQHNGGALMRIHQKGCCVFEPSEEDPQNATTFRACARMTPSLLDGGSWIESVGTTSEAIIQNYENTVMHIFDAVLDSLAKDEEKKSS